MRNLITFEQARLSDKIARETFAMPEIALVERAGMACAQVLFGDMRRRDCGTKHPNRRVVVVCGSSNNGADAQVIAREAYNRGYGVRVLFVSEPKSTNALIQRDTLRALGVGCAIVSHARLRRILSELTEQDYLIDGISGIGLRGTYRYPGVIRAVNKCRARVLSVDVPGGMPGDEHGNCIDADELNVVQADVTASIGARKMSLYHPVYREHCGEIIDADGVFPPAVVSDTTHALHPSAGAPAAMLFESRDIADHTLMLSADTYKHKRGSVVVVAGCEASPGAAFLALRAAGYGPAGVVYGALDTAVAQSAAAVCPSAVIPCEQNEVSSFFSHPACSGRSNRARAWVVGCGWGARDIAVLQNICAIANKYDEPVVLDADALTLLAHEAHSLPREILQCPTMLTPHVGELRALYGAIAHGKNADKCFNILDAAHKVADYYNSVVIVKYSVTHIVSPARASAVPYVIDGRAPLLATGGSGDVLAGFLGSVLANGVAHIREKSGRVTKNALWNMMHTSAAYAVAVHAEAGARLAMRRGSATADNIVNELPNSYSLVPRPNS